MRIWTQKEEAENLGARFVGVNRSAFAREHGLNHNIIYHHIKAVRPISRTYAVAYSKGFKVPLSEISPRLAMEASEASGLDDKMEIESELSEEAMQILKLLQDLDERGRQKVLLAAKDVIDMHEAFLESLPLPASKSNEKQAVNYGYKMPQSDLNAVVNKHYAMSLHDINAKYSVEPPKTQSGSTDPVVKKNKRHKAP